MDLLSCPDFSARQPYGPADMPSFPGHWAEPNECPRCDFETYDMRKRRMVEYRGRGWRVGLGPGKRSPGIDVPCCVVM